MKRLRRRRSRLFLFLWIGLGVLLGSGGIAAFTWLDFDAIAAMRSG